MTIPVDPQSDPLVEVGQLPDERQFLAALLRIDGGWVAVVHFFAAEGEHLESECSEPVGDGEEPPAEAREAFERTLRRLEPYQHDAVTIGTFEKEISGRPFGLVPDPESGGLRMEPDGPVLTPASEGSS